jgi:hypothetical protein
MARTKERTNVFWKLLNSWNQNFLRCFRRNHRFWLNSLHLEHPDKDVIHLLHFQGHITINHRSFISVQLSIVWEEDNKYIYEEDHKSIFPLGKMTFRDALHFAMTIWSRVFRLVGHGGQNFELYFIEFLQCTRGFLHRVAEMRYRLSNPLASWFSAYRPFYNIKCFINCY